MADIWVLPEERMLSAMTSSATKLSSSEVSAALGSESVPSCHPKSHTAIPEPKEGRGKCFLVFRGSSSPLPP